MERQKRRKWAHSKGAPSMKMFDDTYIAPMMECYGGAAEYYRAAAAGPHIHRIRYYLHKERMLFCGLSITTHFVRSFLFWTLFIL